MDSIINQRIFVGTWQQFSLKFYQIAQSYQQEESPVGCSPYLQSVDTKQTMVLYVPPLSNGAIYLADYPQLFTSDFLKIIIIIDTQGPIVLYETGLSSALIQQLMHIVLHPNADCVYVHHFAPQHSLKIERVTLVTFYERAFLDYNVFYEGAGAVNHVYKNFIRGKHAQAYLHGVYCATNNQRMNLMYSSLHTVSDSESSVIVKGIVVDTAHVLYKGTIVIEAPARRTQACQENGTLILGNKAFVESIPVLEVLNNDVSCAHASAVGRLDETQIFYLRTRGLTITQAQLMIINSYLDDVFRNNSALFLKTAMRLVINLLHVV